MRLFNRNETAVAEAAVTPKFQRELNIARLMENHEQVGKASSIYEKVAKEDPANVVARHRLGVLAATRKEFDLAHEHFAAAQQGGEPSAELLADVGYTYFLQGDLEKAEAKYRQSLRIDSYSKSTRNNLGIVLAHQGRDEEALREFKESVDDAEAFSNLAFVQSQIGAIDKAEANYHRALELNNQLAPAAEALIQIASLKGTLQTAPVDASQIARRKQQPPQKQRPIQMPEEIASIEPTGSKESPLQQPNALIQQASNKQSPKGPVELPVQADFQGESAAKQAEPISAAVSDAAVNHTKPTRLTYGDFPQPQTVRTHIPETTIPKVQPIPMNRPAQAPKTKPATDSGPTVMSISG